MYNISTVGFLVNKKWKDNITRVSSGNSRVAELVLRITDRYHLKIVQVYALEKGQKNTKPRKKPDDNTTGQTRQRDPRAR